MNQETIFHKNESPFYRILQTVFYRLILVVKLIICVPIEDILTWISFEKNNLNMKGSFSALEKKGTIIRSRKKKFSTTHDLCDGTTCTDPQGSVTRDALVTCDKKVMARSSDIDMKDACVKMFLSRSNVEGDTAGVLEAIERYFDEQNPEDCPKKKRGKTKSGNYSRLWKNK